MCWFAIGLAEMEELVTLCPEFMLLRRLMLGRYLSMSRKPRKSFELRTMSILDRSRRYCCNDLRRSSMIVVFFELKTFLMEVEVPKVADAEGGRSKPGNISGSFWFNSQNILYFLATLHLTGA